MAGKPVVTITETRRARMHAHKNKQRNSCCYSHMRIDNKTRPHYCQAQTNNIQTIREVFISTLDNWSINEVTAFHLQELRKHSPNQTQGSGAHEVYIQRGQNVPMMPEESYTVRVTEGAFIVQCLKQHWITKPIYVFFLFDITPPYF